MGENKNFATISDVLGYFETYLMRAPKAQAKILGILDYFFHKKEYDVIIFKFQGGAMAPPCRMLATPLVRINR